MSQAVGTCLVCGATSGVRVQLTHWREPIAGRRFENVPRCSDQDACRRAVAGLGDAWPIADPAPTKAPSRSSR